MKTWSFNKDFSSTLYTKVNNLNEYIDAIEALKNSILIQNNYYGETLDVEIYPFKGDIEIWKETFIKEECLNNNILNKDTIKLKPEDIDYPVMLIYKDNYSDLFWIPLDN